MIGNKRMNDWLILRYIYWVSTYLYRKAVSNPDLLIIPEKWKLSPFFPTKGIIANQSQIYYAKNHEEARLITNSSVVFTNLEFRIYICYDLFFNWQIETKSLFWNNEKFFNCSNWEKNCGKNWWMHLINSLVEKISPETCRNLRHAKPKLSVF